MKGEKTIQAEGSLPLSKGHICFDKGHAMFELYLFHNHQSSWGTHKCSRCGYAEDWQYDFISGNPMYNQ